MNEWMDMPTDRWMDGLMDRWINSMTEDQKRGDTVKKKSRKKERSLSTH